MNPFRWLLSILFPLVVAVPAWAAEYRLQVVSLYESSFVYYLDPGSRPDSLLPRLDSALAGQQIPKGAVLYDRWVRPADPAEAKAFRATPVKAESVSDLEAFLPEFRWQGEPGTRTLWVVKAQSFHLPELAHLGLKGTRPLHYVIPFWAALRVKRSQTVGVPVNYIEEFSNGDLWTKSLSRYLDLSDGIVAVVGLQPNTIHPDRVYLVIEQPAEPRSFKVVLGWRNRIGTQERLSEPPGDPGFGNR